jgi:hypothetical protein
VKSRSLKLASLKVLAFTLTLSVGLADGQNLLINGSFEVVDASAPPFVVRSFSSTPGWAQILDGVDLTHNNSRKGPRCCWMPQTACSFWT